MAHTFELPDPGEGIHEAEVVELHVSEGDQVQESDVLLEVETDKAVVEIPAPFTGRIQEVLVTVGDDVQVGDGVLTWEAEGSEEPEAEPADEEPTDEAGAAREPSDDRPVPAAPATRRLARELEVDLRQVEGSGPEGRVTREDVRAAAGEGGEEAETAPDEAPREERPEPAEEESAGAEEAAAAEAEEAPEAESEEELAAGSEAEEPARPEERPAGAVSAPSPDYGDPEEWGPVERRSLRSVRRTTARRMADAWRRIPHVTHVDHADITELEELRAEHAAAMEDGDLTLTVFLLKALVAVLKEFPRFNARLDEDQEEIVLLDYHHLGVAVDTDRGLLVPVVRDVDGKSLAELAAELEGLVEATRSREVTRDQMRGGTFTLTNPGPLGGDVLTPIINPPQVAILGAGRATLRPVVREGADGHEIQPRLILPVCLSFDHRVNDGADAARFCARLVEILEDPDAFVRHL